MKPPFEAQEHLQHELEEPERLLIIFLRPRPSYGHILRFPVKHGKILEIYI